MKVNIACGNPTSGKWESVLDIDFPECTNNWLGEGRLPTQDEVLPKRSIGLPSGEELELGLFRSPDNDTTNIFLFGNGKNFITVLATGSPLLIFTSPGGTVVQLMVVQ